MPAEQAAMPRADAVCSQRVAGCAAGIQLLAAQCVRRCSRSSRCTQRQYGTQPAGAARGHDMKAEGTGTSPMAWRRMLMDWRISSMRTV